MTTSEEIAARLALSEGELFGDDDTVLRPREMELIMDFDFEGLALAGPERLATGARERLPVLLASRAPGARGFEVDRFDNGFLAAIDLHTAEVHLGPAFEDPKLLEHPPSERPAPTPPDPATVSMASAKIDRVDARAATGLPWRPGRLRLVAFEWDWRSNPHDVELEGGDPPPDPAPRAVAPPRPAPPDDPAEAPAALPTYLPGPDPLDAGADAPALAFTVAPGPGALVVRGALRAIARPTHLVPAGVEVLERDGAAHPVGAVVPVTLAFAERGSSRPARLDLAVPAYLPSPAADGTPLAGFFEVDALAELEPEGLRVGLPPGAYQAWAFFEGAVFGPVAFTI